MIIFQLRLSTDARRLFFAGMLLLALLLAGALALVLPALPAVRGADADLDADLSAEADLAWRSGTRGHAAVSLVRDTTLRRRGGSNLAGSRSRLHSRPRDGLSRP